MTRVAQFEIHHSACLGPDGKPVQALPQWSLDREILIELYRHMVLTRHFDSKAVALQRTGRLGCHHVSHGSVRSAVAAGYSRPR